MLGNSLWAGSSGSPLCMLMVTGSRQDKPRDVPTSVPPICRGRLANVELEVCFAPMGILTSLEVLSETVIPSSVVDVVGLWVSSLLEAERFSSCLLYPQSLSLLR